MPHLDATTGDDVGDVVIPEAAQDSL